MSKITVYFVKTGESLDVPDINYCVLDTLLTADGLVVAIESGCCACGGGRAASPARRLAAASRRLVAPRRLLRLPQMLLRLRRHRRQAEALPQGGLFRLNSAVGRGRMLDPRL